jgi:hypothetical protein
MKHRLRRHCEQRKAIQFPPLAQEGWIASSVTLLAMTVKFFELNIRIDPPSRAPSGTTGR